MNYVTYHLQLTTRNYFYKYSKTIKHIAEYNVYEGFLIRSSHLRE